MLWLPVLWNVISVCLVGASLITIRRDIYLHRYGRVAIASVVRKRDEAEPEDCASSSIKYTFLAMTPKGTGEIISGWKRVPTRDYETIQVGDDVILLYDPNNPRRNVLYRHDIVLYQETELELGYTQIQERYDGMERMDERGRQHVGG